MSYDTFDLVPYSVHVEKVVSARIEHRCDACAERIRPGYHYAKIFVVLEREADTIKRCMRCQRLHNHLAEKGANHDMYPAEKLDCGETYQDHWGEDPPEEIAALAFALPSEVEPSLEDPSL